MRDGWVNDRLMVVSWIGINDVRLDKDVHDCMTQLFDMTEMLYLNGARKIIYMTVPPLERTPAGTSLSSFTTSSLSDSFLRLL